MAACALLREHRPTLLAVGFDQAHGWRRNPVLGKAADEVGLNLLVLSLDPLVIDGQVFDPAQHFAAWRRRDESAMAQLRLAATEGVLATLAATPPGPGRWRSMADWLNGRGVRTIRGGTWTPENVRKLVVRTGHAG